MGKKPFYLLWYRGGDLIKRIMGKKPLAIQAMKRFKFIKISSPPNLLPWWDLKAATASSKITRGSRQWQCTWQCIMRVIFVLSTFISFSQVVKQKIKRMLSFLGSWMKIESIEWTWTRQTHIKMEVLLFDQLKYINITASFYRGIFLHHLKGNTPGMCFSLSTYIDSAWDTWHNYCGGGGEWCKGAGTGGSKPVQQELSFSENIDHEIWNLKLFYAKTKLTSEKKWPHPYWR